MSLHTVFLNNTEVPIPKDYDRFTQKVERDYDKRLIRVPYPATFTFAGAGYDFLRQMFLEDICDTVRFRAFETCNGTRYSIIRGEIALSDCKFDLQHCTVEVAVEDDTIGSRIANNFRIPISPRAPLSKNGTTIDAVPITDLLVFNPGDPEPDYLPNARAMFDWYACMQHAIQYMSDGAVTLTSDWYEGLGVAERLALCSGFQLRTASNAEEGIRITYTFEDLWLEVAKRFNLWLSVSRDIQGNPTILLEPEADMFPSTAAFELLWQEGLIQSVDADRLFSAVVVGDEKGLKNLGPVESLPFLVLQTHSEERFHFSGQCNRDVVMELGGQWITDTNIIERVTVLDTTSTDYDADIFIIQYSTYTGAAVKGDYLNPGNGPYLYNELMLNFNILDRYDLPSDVGQYFDASTANFRASHPAPFGTLGQMPQPPNQFEINEIVLPPGYLNFPDETTPPNEDPGGNWDQVVTYTAPAQGYYEFGWEIPWSSTHISFGFAPAEVWFIAEMQRFDSGNVFLGGQRVNSSSRFTSGVSLFTGSFGFVLNTGDYVRFALIRAIRRNVQGSPGTASIQPQAPASIFTQFVAAGGGVVTTTDPLAPRVIKYEFERLIPISQWQALTNDPRLGVSVSNTGGLLRRAHVLEATRDVERGRTSFTLIAPKREPL